MSRDRARFAIGVYRQAGGYCVSFICRADAGIACLLAVGGLAFLLTPGCSTNSGNNSTAGCNNEGVHYQEGQQYCCSSDYTPTATGNTCICSNGQIDSDGIACGADAGEAGCTYEGVHYEEGQQYCCSSDYTPTARGNTCICLNGQIDSDGIACGLDSGAVNDATGAEISTGD